MKALRVKLGLALLMGVGGGVWIGITYSVRTIGMGSGMMSQWAAVGEYAGLANFQYQYADEPHARGALLDFLSFVEKLRSTDKVMDQKALEISVARAYVRLAVLDRHTGNAGGYQLDLSLAQAALRAAGSPHSSSEDVERAVSQLESQR